MIKTLKIFVAKFRIMVATLIVRTLYLRNFEILSKMKFYRTANNFLQTIQHQKMITEQNTIFKTFLALLDHPV